MNPVKICDKCAEKFRGSAANEVRCAKCEVTYCDVPSDTDQEFVKISAEIYGPTFNTMLPLGDLMGHKTRLKRVEEQLEKSRKSTKEKNRIKRDVHRLREENKAMEELMDSIKSKLMQVALLKSYKSSVPLSPTSRTSSISVSTPPSSSKPSPVKFQTPSIITTSPRSPTEVKSPPPQQQQQQQQIQMQQQPQSLPSCLSPVKTTAAKFEQAAKKVNSVVTFAKVPTKRPEVNNNDTPVTASSSSEDDEDDSGKPQVFLTRSNSVRDRVKAFEEIQRRASTGSCDRKPAAFRSINKNRKSLNVL